MEGRSKRLLPVDGFGSRVDRPRPPPVPRVREPPAHLDHPSRARFSIPNDDRQQTANAIGDDFVVAALVATWSFASAALCEWLGKRDNFAPGCQGRKFTAHGGTLSSPPATALSRLGAPLEPRRMPGWKRPLIGSGRAFGPGWMNRFACRRCGRLKAIKPFLVIFPCPFEQDLDRVLHLIVRSA